jgi:hypothetical protein
MIAQSYCACDRLAALLVLAANTCALTCRALRALLMHVHALALLQADRLCLSCAVQKHDHQADKGTAAY